MNNPFLMASNQCCNGRRITPKQICISWINNFEIPQHNKFIVVQMNPSNQCCNGRIQQSKFKLLIETQTSIFFFYLLLLKLKKQHQITDSGMPEPMRRPHVANLSTSYTQLEAYHQQPLNGNKPAT